MEKEVKFTQTDEKLNQLVERKNLSKGRLKTYINCEKIVSSPYTKLKSSLF